jgi:hypothetical protein
MARPHIEAFVDRDVALDLQADGLAPRKPGDGMSLDLQGEREIRL